MAINVYVPKDKRYGIALQSTWGTAIADDAAFMEPNFEHFEFKPDIRVQNNNTAHGSREKTYGDFAVASGLALSRAPLKGVLNLNDFCFLAYSFFQYVSEGASTPFAKTIRRHLTQPDFSVNAGCFLTVIERDPVQAYKAADVVVESLKLSFKVGDVLRFEAGLVARGNPATCTPSGSWTVVSISALPSGALSPLISTFDRFTLNFGGGDVSPKLQEFTFDLKRASLIGVGGAAGGNYETLGLGDIQGTFDFKLMKDANFATALTNLAAGTALSGRIGRGNATAGTVGGDFDITFTGKLTEAPTAHDEQLLGMNLKGEFLAADASSPSFTIVLADLADRGF